jgi:hypothetical protein
MKLTPPSNTQANSTSRYGAEALEQHGQYMQPFMSYLNRRQGHGRLHCIPAVILVSTFSAHLLSCCCWWWYLNITRGLGPTLTSICYRSVIGKFMVIAVSRRFCASILLIGCCRCLCLLSSVWLIRFGRNSTVLSCWTYPIHPQMFTESVLHVCLCVCQVSFCFQDISCESVCSYSGTYEYFGNDAGLCFVISVTDLSRPDNATDDDGIKVLGYDAVKSGRTLSTCLFIPTVCERQISDVKVD